MQVGCWVLTRGTGPSVKCLFGFTYVELCALLTALACLNQITQSGCFLTNWLILSFLQFFGSHTLFCLYWFSIFLAVYCSLSLHSGQRDVYILFKNWNSVNVLHQGFVFGLGSGLLASAQDNSFHQIWIHMRELKVPIYLAAQSRRLIEKNVFRAFVNKFLIKHFNKNAVLQNPPPSSYLIYRNPIICPTLQAVAAF